MNFKRARGEPNIQPYIKAASTTMNFGDAVALVAGFIQPAANNTAAKDIIGVVQETISSTDSDFATARAIAVDVAEKGDNGDWFEAVIGAGTPVQANAGTSYDLFTAGAGVDFGNTTYKQVKLQGLKTATTVIVSFTGAPGTNVS